MCCNTGFFQSDSSLNRNILECKYRWRSAAGIDYQRLNRNILECKYEAHKWGDIVCQVLIETYWNVNEKTHCEAETARERLNRNILECKSRSASPNTLRFLRLNRNILECKSNSACEM